MKNKNKILTFLVVQKNSSFIEQTKNSLELKGFLVNVHDTADSLFLSIMSKEPELVFISDKYEQTNVTNIISRLKVQYKIKVVSLNEQLDLISNGKNENKTILKGKTQEDKIIVSKSTSLNNKNLIHLQGEKKVELIDDGANYLKNLIETSKELDNKEITKNSKPKYSDLTGNEDQDELEKTSGNKINTPILVENTMASPERLSDQASECVVCAFEGLIRTGYLILHTSNLKDAREFVYNFEDGVNILSINLAKISTFKNIEDKFIEVSESQNFNVFYIEVNDVKPLIDLLANKNSISPSYFNSTDKLKFDLFLYLKNRDKKIKYLSIENSFSEEQLEKLIKLNKLLYFKEEDRDKILLYLQTKQIIKKEQL